MMKTLDEYLKEGVRNGVVDYSIRASFRGGKVVFYIHPAGVSGDTLDFSVCNNILYPEGWAVSSNQPGS